MQNLGKYALLIVSYLFFVFFFALFQMIAKYNELYFDILQIMVLKNQDVFKLICQMHCTLGLLQNKI